MAGLLSDVLPWVYSQGDRAKRYMKGLLSDPVGSMVQGVNNANDRAGGLLAVTRAAAQEGALGNGPATQQLTNMLIDAYNPVGMFIGPNAKTWDKTAAQLAQKLDARGVDPRAIWKETGTFKGPDGKWRQEIDDSAAGLRLDKPMFGESVDTAQMQKLPVYLDHKQAFKAYPDAKNINTTWTDASSGASYSAPRSYAEYIDLPVNASIENKRSSVLHELQHAIQQREGFARGGSPEAMRGSSDVAQLVRVLEARADAAREAGDKAAYMAATDARAKLLREDGYGGYKNLAGEAEARATQARMNMGMQQRRDLFPLDSYDVPIDQLILR